MLYTKSSIREYNSCPLRYQYKYIDRIDITAPPFLIEPSSAMQIGINVHSIFETNQRLESTDYKSQLANVMWECSFYAEKELQFPHLNIIEREKELYTDIGEFHLGGKVDAIATMDNSLWIIDYKTSSRILKDSFYYEMQTEFDFYTYLARANRYEAKGVILYYLRRPSLYRRKKETNDEYISRCAEDIINRIDTYYKLIKIPKEKINEKDIINTIAHCELDTFSGYFRRNTNNCNEYNSKCVYAPLCLGIMDKKDCQIKEQPHSELKENK